MVCPHLIPFSLNNAKDNPAGIACFWEEANNGCIRALHTEILVGAEPPWEADKGHFACGFHGSVSLYPCLLSFSHAGMDCHQSAKS